MQKNQFFDNSNDAVDFLIKKVGKDIRVLMPVALGKANKFMNTLYQRAVEDPSIHLEITSALELEIPEGKSELERRFFKRVKERLWKNVPELDYFKALRDGTLPDNVKVYNLYSKSGQLLDIPALQKNYLNFNYTLIGRSMLERGINVICSMFSKKTYPDGTVMISSGSNSDLYYEMLKMMRKKAENSDWKFAAVGEVNPNMPFLYGDGTFPADEFDILLDGEETDYPLFAVPKASVGTIEHFIGLHVSTLVKDGGTIQIGIGALGDAIASSILMRHLHNEDYVKALKELGIEDKFGDIIDELGGRGTFEEGLLASSEMFVEAFLPMFKEGIIKRKIYDNLGVQKLINEGKIVNETIPGNIIELLMENGEINGYIDNEQFLNLQSIGVFKEDLNYDDIKQYMLVDDPSNLEKVQNEFIGDTLKNGYCINGAFFLGSEDFYKFLLEMDEDMRKLIRMDSVLKLNCLYGDEHIRRAQRKDGRFFNTGMKLSVLGGVASDQLENGMMISGVGGQYNFVEMGQNLEDGRSVILIKTTKGSGKKLISNIVYNYGHYTIPRHLKDIVITEYGIADIRDKSDEETIKAILNITDSRFQEKILREAKSNGKISKDYEIPEEFRNNTPEMLEEKLKPFREKGYFKPFPLGVDFTPDELTVAAALKKAKHIAETDKKTLFKTLLKKIDSEKMEKAAKYLEFMELENPANFHEKIYTKILLMGLEANGVI